MALPDTKRVGRGLILCRDQRSIVTWAVFDQRADNFQRAKYRFRRVQPYEQIQTFTPRFSHSGGTSASSAELFLEYLERKLCNIAFPLSLVLVPGLIYKKRRSFRVCTVGNSSQLHQARLAARTPVPTHAL